VGAGNGAMARDVLKALPWRSRWHARLHLVEESPAFRALQQQRLRGWQVTWHDSLKEALAACHGRALIYSNELVDAFPCNLFERRGGIWREVGLMAGDDWVRECLMDIPPNLTAPEQFSIWEAWVAVEEGQRAAIHDSYREWLGAWSGQLEAGAVLTIDYGAGAEDLCRGRPSGAVRGYFQHQVLEDKAVYQRFGLQDLTADVNFTDLERWGGQAGWSTEFYVNQAEFIRSRVSTAASTIEDMLRIRQLTEEHGAGGSFKVLCQSRGLAAKQFSC